MHKISTGSGISPQRLGEERGKLKGYGCVHKISTGSGISPQRLGEERGKLDRNNNYNKAYFGLRIYICPAEAVQLSVSCVVGLLLTQNFNRVWCQSLKMWGGERETQ